MTLLARRGDGAAVSRDDLSGDRQAQPGSRGPLPVARLIVAVEDPVELVRLDPQARVGNMEFQATLGARGEHRDLISRVAELERVGQEVAEHFVPKPILIAEDRRRRRWIDDD